MIKVIKRGGMEHVTKCVNCHNFIMYDTDAVIFEIVGGQKLKSIRCPECDTVQHLYAWNIVI